MLRFTPIDKSHASGALFGFRIITDFMPAVAPSYAHFMRIVRP